MPDLMISPTPTPPASPPGNANALGRSDAAGRAGESAKTGREGGAEAPFAAELKSRMEKKAAAADTTESANSAAVAAPADAGNATVSIDLAALLPLLGATAADPAAKHPVPSAGGTELPGLDADEKLTPELQPAAEQAPPPMLAALSSAPPAPTGTGERKRNTETENQLVLPTGAKEGVPGQTSGKIALDAAITADTGHESAETNAQETPASDFHALMERAAATTTGGTSPLGGPAANPGVRIETPLGRPGWHEEVGQKLTWMAGNGRQQADLVLTPPQLGRVEVSLTMNGDQATAVFTSSNPAVREALENSMHRLREVLADAGVSLGQTQVGSESPNQFSPGKEPDFGVKGGAHYASSIAAPTVAVAARASAGRGMVDVFA